MKQLTTIITGKDPYQTVFINCNWRPTAQKMKFSIKYFFSKCDQICSFLRIWSHLLKNSLMKNFIFCAVTLTTNLSQIMHNPFQATGFFLYLVRRSENHRFDKKIAWINLSTPARRRTISKNIKVSCLS